MTGKDKRGEFGGMSQVGKLTLNLRRDPDPAGWVITHHEVIADPR